VVATHETLSDLLAGRCDPVAAFYRGELEVWGDMALAMHFAARLTATE
jgi:putative sterol carrier protein